MQSEEVNQLLAASRESELKQLEEEIRGQSHGSDNLDTLQRALGLVVANEDDLKVQAARLGKKPLYVFHQGG